MNFLFLMTMFFSDAFSMEKKEFVYDWNLAGSIGFYDDTDYLNVLESVRKSKRSENAILYIDQGLDFDSFSELNKGFLGGWKLGDDTFYEKNTMESYKLTSGDKECHGTSVIGSGIQVYPDQFFYVASLINWDTISDEHGNTGNEKFTRLVDHVIEHNVRNFGTPIKVVNMSFGSPAYEESNLFWNDIERLITSGILVVEASGNESNHIHRNKVGEGKTPLDFLARIYKKHGPKIAKRFILAGSYDFKKRFPSDYSTYVPYDVYSQYEIYTLGDVYTSVPNNKQSKLSGTSFAAPNICSALLMLIDLGLNVDDARDRLFETAWKQYVGNFTFHIQGGTKHISILNLKRALNTILEKPKKTSDSYYGNTGNDYPTSSGNNYPGSSYSLPSNPYISGNPSYGNTGSNFSNSSGNNYPSSSYSPPSNSYTGNGSDKMEEEG